MKRIFLTSGIIVCMACPAFAVSDNLTGSGEECVIEDLGTATDGDTVQVEAKWAANISGAITLDSNRYASSAAETAATTADTAAGVTPVYSKYATGIYGSSADATAETNPITALTTQPVMTGYSFQGFYTGKAGNGTQVICNGYQYLPAAKTVVENAGETDTWYAHWTANSYDVTYAPGAHGLGAGRTITNGVTFDSNYTILGLGDATDYSGVTAPAGYTFAGWQESLTGNAIRQSGYEYTPYHNAGSLTLTAQWTTNQYTISYLPGLAGSHTALENYVTGSTAATNVDFDMTNISLAANGFAATGYHFTGWLSSYDLEDNTLADTTYGSAEVISQYRHPDSIALTAQWAANQTTVTYSCGATQENGITGSAPESDTATYDANFAFADNLAQGGCAKTGWTFDGWTCSNLDGVQTAGGLGETWLYEGAHQGSISCVAHFTANTININWYNDEGDTVPMEVQEGAQSCTYDGSVTLPDAQHQPSKTGYTFGGWKVRE